MARKSKGVRCKYNRDNLEHAVAAVKSGRHSIRSAAKEFSVPKSTLSDRITGRVAHDASPGKVTVIPIEVENEISEKIKEAGKMGFGITRAQLCMKVSRIALAMKIKTPFRNGIPGKDWVGGFKKRHPDVSLRSPTPLNSVRARMLNFEVTNKYFTDLGLILHDLNINNSPHLIWNIDETNVSLTHKPSKVLAETGQRNVPGRVGNCRDGVTVLACVNAAGHDIPPLVIVRGNTQKALRAYNVAQGPHGAKYTFQKKAWMEDILGVTWFKDHFLKYCGPERPQLIVLDSHSSHETIGLISLARENDIHLFALPPHTTQYLNPLDKTVFGPFQREYNRQCTEFMSSSPNHLVTKWEWPRLFKSAYLKSFNKENIAKGFEFCGVFPFNPSSIPKSAFAPSQPFDKTSYEAHGDQDIGASLIVNTPTPILEFNTSESSAVPEGATVIATADENGYAEIDDPSTLLNLIVSGQLEIVSSPNVSVNIGRVDSNSWSEEINKEFELPAPAEQKTKKVSKKITCHRLLTSDEIFEQKLKEKEQKEILEQEKAERKRIRELKALEKKRKDIVKKEGISKRSRLN